MGLRRCGITEASLGRRPAAVLFFVLLFPLTGCAALGRMADTGSKPAPQGPTPFQEIGSGIYHLLMNPLDVGAWLQIIGAGGVVLGAGVGAKKARGYVRAKKAAAKPQS
jgi:hypothetical protein